MDIKDTIYEYPINMIKKQKIFIEVRYKKDGTYCRDFMCSSDNMPLTKMRIPLLASFGTVDFIEQRENLADGTPSFRIYVKEDGGKSSNGLTYKN